MSSIVGARVLHVLAVVLWIGGVAFVTTVLLPAVAQLKDPQERVAFFEAVEVRFAWQARLTTVLAGTSGFYLVYRMNVWDWFARPERWYLPAMAGVWMLFTLMLFVFEPLFLHRWFLRRAETAPESTFRTIQGLHILLLIVSLLATAGAVAAAHGWLWVG